MCFLRHDRQTILLIGFTFGDVNVSFLMQSHQFITSTLKNIILVTMFHGNWFR
jgi:hypothetical protein